MPFDSHGARRTLAVNGTKYDYFSLAAAEAAGLAGISELPRCLKVIVENVLRRHAAGTADAQEVQNLQDWLREPQRDCEVSFLPARVMMPESSGITLLGDMAAMRDAMVDLGGDPGTINPVLPVDFIVDHSVNAHQWGHAGALAHNMDVEMRENRERYEFLRWASDAFDGLRIFPPGSGILHQINLEHLAKVVWTREEGGTTLAYPDSLIAMDSHTAMVNSLGVVAWGVGGFEGGTVALGEPVSLLIPETVGVRLSGRLAPGVTSTDLVLYITQTLRRHDVIGCFVEYFGPGVAALALPERATVSNMTPEIGATMGFFAVDEQTLRFLRLTGRDEQHVALVEAYSKAQGLWRDDAADPKFRRVVEIDLAEVDPCVSGPSRPDARVPLAQAPQAFRNAVADSRSAPVEGMDHALANGDIVVAAITSCTNTSNPNVLIGAGLLARNARRRGLSAKPWVKTTLSPGSRVVADYLAASGLQRFMDELGFHIAGFGCMSCMGNSGPLAEPVAKAIESGDLATVAVLSGNRNFDGRIHGHVKVNFLASPPLVVAYAIAGRIGIDLTKEPLGTDSDGQPVFLRDIWPDDAEIQSVIDATLTPAMFLERYATLREGTPQWRALASDGGKRFAWRPASRFIRRPPYFEGMQRHEPPRTDIRGARMLGMFGDMLTTDHISPIGTIAPTTPAGRYLQDLGVKPAEFVNYAARRLNHDVMVRGTFANTRLKNEITPGIEGSSTRHFPDGAQMSIFDAAERYRAEGVPAVVVAGREYGAGSSRDWAAKGTDLLGVRAVIAESFERIHRSNLVSMGVLPLQFAPGTTRKTLVLDGSETFDITGFEGELAPKMTVQCTITRADGRSETIPLVARMDSHAEVNYWRDGGIVKYALRRRLPQGAETANV
ncbi:aconitate hydratase AcnA [Ramlibacter sp.]|uniref:aconitate hydratase AcnA n=1 Tax=Ramlibacter sp. TaxID=1917967 RepID=UPI003D0ED260